MRKYFFITLAAISLLVIATIAYGAYLNSAGENQIAMRMADRTIPLQGAVAKTRSIRTRLVLDSINLYSNEMTDAVALLDGRITSVNVKKNTSVRAGDVLFNLTNEELPLKIKQAEIDIIKIDSEILKADSEIVKAQSYLARAKNDYARYARLRERDAVSREKFDEVTAMLQEAQVNFEVASLQKKQVLAQRDSVVAQHQQLLLENSHSEVTAPIDGEILIIYKQLGSYVTAGTPLALVGNFRTLYFSIPVTDYVAKNFADAGTITIDFNRATFSKIYDTDFEAGNNGENQRFIASILEVSPAISQPAAMRTIIWQVNNKAGLLEPQTFNNVIIQTLSNNPCLTIPLAAMTDDSRTTVFVADENGILEKRNVTSGIDDGTFIEIISGLREGEVVVTSGVDGLADGMKADITLKETEHIH